ncbi:hypothetical protein GQ44DRAFT_733945 [Phaeosphaeriaceae sp. PMI808]|nr:hypothetical protein GQ44DRAFT_733945 [Phaeosphaeriaceae sp. PMI808]
MDAYPVAALAAQEKPVLGKWWTPEHKNSVISLMDLAEASAKVLNERESHYLAEYPLCSNLPISEAEIVRIIEKRVGKEVAIIAPAFEIGVKKLATSLYGRGLAGDIEMGELGLGLASEGDLRGDLVRDTVEALIQSYNKRGLKGNPNVMRWLLGCEPTSVAQWVDSITLP